MTWPFERPVNTPTPDPVNAAERPPEKTAAELIADALKPLVEAQTAFQTKLDERLHNLENQTKPREPKTPTNPAEPISVLDDENAAFAQRMTPILQRQLEFESRVVKKDIKNEYHSAGYGDLWNQFEAEIDAMCDNAPLVSGEGKTLRGDPQYIRNVVDMVLGRAARKAGMRFDGKSKGFFLESASSGPEAAGRGDNSDGMTELQRKVTARMGIPLDKAKDAIKKLHFVN
jgi:hypothetical protein